MKHTPQASQQPKRVDHQTCHHQIDHPRAVSETKYNNSRHQRCPDTPQ